MAELMFFISECIDFICMLFWHVGPIRMAALHVASVEASKTEMYQRTQTFHSANTNEDLREIRHFNSLINQHEAMQIKATGEPFSSEMPPCSRCSVRIQQGDFVFDQRNQRSYNALHVAS
jgi:hypothetical protein